MHNPPHPGEIMREFCVEPLNINVTEAARALGVARKTLSALLYGRAGISPEMALRLSKVFGRLPEGWLKLQLQYDLWKAKQSVNIDNLKRIEAVRVADDDPFDFAHSPGALSGAPREKGLEVREEYGKIKSS